MSSYLLVVEDETAIRDMVGFTLERAGFTWSGAVDTAEAYAQIARHLPDLIILDWMLPGISGIDFAKRIRRNDTTKEIPIIMLTARGEEIDRIKGFDAGADDYICKPFSPKELIARVKAVLRRASPVEPDKVHQVKGLRLDASSHRVSIEGQSLDIGPTEFRLLYFFMTHPERVYNRGQLLDNVWGSNVYIEDRTVDVHIRRLRKALANHRYDKLIQTVRGAGYRFSVQE
ncbi:MAG: phosphate regulon transcriptional regulatory protein PhoB [Gammaproteobacteria bacterium]|nr:phosphate regulon transcriptional regulatory protein PhoB [Gammaproteobacteria bacterium]